jgi:peptidoglycan hydrolase-like protein with peptidoglycan-binding domain
MLALQQSLARLGYGAIKADGMFGDNTRQAVRSFQIAQKLPADGYPTDDILRRVTALDPAATSPAQRLEAARRGSPLLGVAGVKQLQQQLNRLGYKLGTPNGKSGPKTQAAIRAEEKSLGLAQTGRATAFMLAQVKARAR